MKNKEVIVGISAGVAAYKSCDIVRSLKKSGLDVSCVMTKEAEEFIRPLTFQALSGNKVYRDLFELNGPWDVEHVSLADRCSCLLIAPATANIIAKLACGIADDLLTCVVLATKAPVLIAPAMNDNMYNHKIVRENIRKLVSTGYKIIPPRRGELACGRTAVGCLAEVDVIVKEVLRVVSKR